MNSMSFLALLALALGQQPCPHASKTCPQAQVQRCQETKGCLVRAEAEDESDMGEAEFLADPMGDQVIAAAANKPRHTISLGFAFGKDKPAAVTVVFTKKKEEEGKEERIQGQFYAFGPIVSRCEVSILDEDEEEACEECPAATKACEKCPAVKASACAKCPAAQCDSAKACDKCPAVKASACGKCPAAQCDSAKACGECPACPAEQAVVQGPVAGEVVQAQAVTFVSTTSTEQGKPARRRLFRRR